MRKPTPTDSPPDPLAVQAGRVRQRSWLLVALCAGCLSLGALAFTPAARAGEWIEVSCVNPNGSAAPSQGWAAMAAGAGYGSNADSSCGPGSPAYALLSSQAPAPVGAFEALRYQPPSGSTLTGGQVALSMRADGGGYDASGTAVAFSPELVYDGSNVFFQCASGLTPCAPGSNDYTGVLTLPSGRGGDLYLSAGCGGEPGASCNQSGSDGAWSAIEMYSAQLRLASAGTPSASGFAGSLLSAPAHGTSWLTFTAAEAEGPGIYSVSVQGDGQTLYDGVPETNGGSCVPVASSGATLMFDSSQPCKHSESVALAIDTTALFDGTHNLTVTVTDAAGNSSVVEEQTITTQNGLPAPQLGAPNGLGASEHATLRLSGPTRLDRSYAQRELRLTGKLTSASGAPIAGASVEISERHAGSASTAALAHALTAADGSFTASVPAGPSRTIVIGYRPYALVGYAAQASVQETVRAHLDLRVSPRATGSRGSILLHGQVAGPLPRRGVLVQLLVHYRGRWEPFRDTRTTRSGRYAVRYQFEGGVGRFPFRAEVLGEQAGFPYATGQSAQVDVQSG